MNDEIVFVTKKVNRLEKDELAMIKNFLINIFSDHDGYEKSVYTNPDLDSCVLMYLDNRFIGHVGITKRIVDHKSREYLVGGIGDVAIDKKLQGKGLGKILMKEVEKQLRLDNYDLGVLFCHPDLDKFYASCGWKKKETGKIWAIRKGVKEDQRRTFILPLKMNIEEINVWNTDEIEIGVGSW